MSGFITATILLHLITAFRTHMECCIKHYYFK